MSREKMLISAYVDGEVESPWKEKLENLIEQKSEWRHEESVHRKMDLLLSELPEGNLEKSKQTVWLAIQGRIAAKELDKNSPARNTGRVIRSLVPLGAAALVLFALGAGYWWGVQSSPSGSSLAEIRVQIPQNYDFQLHGDGQLLQMSNYQGNKP